MPEARRCCILAAGHGSHPTDAESVPAALLPVSRRAALSRAIEQLPRGTEFVIAVGDRGDLIREYLSLVHSGLPVRWVDVGDADPAAALSMCRPHLEGSFWLCFGDRPIDAEVSPHDTDWIGVAPVERAARHTVAELDEAGRVCALRDEIARPGSFAFTGLAAIHSCDGFWEAIDAERDLTAGVAALIPRGLESRPVKRRDIDRNHAARRDAVTYFERDLVVKHFADPTAARSRAERADLLRPQVPEVVAASEHFYAYRYLPGVLLADVVDNVRFADFLRWCDFELWRGIELDADETRTFHQDCRAFYRDKTLRRLELYRSRDDSARESRIVNGEALPSLDGLLDRVDWDWLSRGVPSRIHGDLHFHNVIVPDSIEQGRYRLLDWRQDFAGSLTCGDLYYDLAKLHHGLVLSVDQIHRGFFSVVENGGEVRFSYLTSSQLIDCQQVLAKFVTDRGLDYRKVELLSQLVFLNMAPLYPAPFNRLLYALGHLGLSRLDRSRSPVGQSR